MNDFNFDFGGKKELGNLENFSRYFITLSNAGDVTKSTFAETLVEFLDFAKVEREFYSLDVDHTFTYNKFANKNKNGSVAPKEEQDPKVNMGLIDITKSKDMFVNTTKSKTKYKIADGPARGIDDILLNAFEGNVQALIDTFRAQETIPYFCIPYISAKCQMTAQRVYDLMADIDTDLPIHIVFFINKGAMKNKKETLSLYESDKNVQQLKKKFIVHEIVNETMFSPSMISLLKTKKLFEILKNSDDMFSCPHTETLIRDYLYTAKDQYLALVK